MQEKNARNSDMARTTLLYSDLGNCGTCCTCSLLAVYLQFTCSLLAVYLQINPAIKFPQVEGNLKTTIQQKEERQIKEQLMPQVSR